MSVQTYALQAQYTGHVLAPPQARTAILDGEGHAVPVLCVELELDNPMRTHMTVELPYPPNAFAQCQADAHRFKKHMHVTVQAPMVGMRLVAKNASSIAPIPAAAAAPISDTTSSLF